ncbi:glycosyltransferase family 2 protein [Leuconostoc mesenteroides]|uniref:glycosyltransferase family 2 protein n=1 Tax=Leuconostoc mesenteroides TaxID=1245 RepID=UPI003CEF78FA
MLSLSKVSIIIPVFNAGEHIFHLISDLQQQTFREFEAIFIDDGSTDNTSKVIKDFMSEDKRIKLVRQNNLGVSSARKRGWEESSSDFIIFIDSDDRFSSNFVSEYFKTIVRTGNDIEFFSIHYENEDRSTKHFGFLKENDRKTFSASDLLIQIGSLKLWGYPFMYISKRASWNLEMFDKSFRIQEDTVAIVNFILANPNLKAGTNSLSYYRYVYNPKSAMHSLRAEDYWNMVDVGDTITKRAKLSGFSSNIIRILNGVKLSALMNVVANSILEKNWQDFEISRTKFLKTYKQTKIINRNVYIRRFLQYILIEIRAKHILSKLYSNMK